MNRNFIALVMTLIAILFTNIIANADNQDELVKLVQDPAEQQLVLNAAKQSSVVLQNPCKSAQFTFVNQFTIYQPLKFDNSGKIIEGAWKQTVSESGCEQNRLLNVAVFFDSQSRTLKAIPTLPGSTRADPTLQQDAQMYASIAATRPRDKDCPNTYIADTKFLQEVGEPLEGVKEKPWNELWTLTGCGKTAQVTMHFIPDKTGTTINTTPEETKFLAVEK